MADWTRAERTATEAAWARWRAEFAETYTVLRDLPGHERRRVRDRRGAWGAGEGAFPQRPGGARCRLTISGSSAVP
jgi:hypothetical protein